MKFETEHFEQLKLSSEVTVLKPVSYSFRFAGYSGWAIFTICDATGQFSIQSDWGNYNYRWHVDALGGGRKLTQFLLECDNAYIVNKFSYDNKHDLGKVVDEEATLAEIRDYICKQRRSRDLKADEARGYWDEATHWVKDQGANADRCDDDLFNFLQEPWEYVNYKDSQRTVFLRDHLLPFFFTWLKEYLAKQ